MQRIFRLVTILFVGIIFYGTSDVSAQVSVDEGSYATAYPGADAAGRNGFLPGAPQLSGAAAGRPAPTNDWWSKLLLENHADNLFNYPMTFKTVNNGLVVTFIPWGVIGDSAPIELGIEGLTATKTTISDYSDWTVDMHWQDADQSLRVRAGVGMPFIYLKKTGPGPLQVIVRQGTAVVTGHQLLVKDASYGADFVVYAPSGSSWSQSGTTYSSNLDGKDYASLAMLPQQDAQGQPTTQTPEQWAELWKKYAFVVPTQTQVAWAYDQPSATLRSDFTVDVEVLEGANDQLLSGLLPHQWSRLAEDTPIAVLGQYTTPRGALKLREGNTFSTVNLFRGILPDLPHMAPYSAGYSPGAMDEKINQIQYEGLATWTDSYNEGQVLNRMIQTARVAHKTGNTAARDRIVQTVKTRLENWLTYTPSEVAFLFYYHAPWTAMLGYPAGHGQDTNLNDHHFHWGYFIHAAAFMEQFEPGWAEKWGGMINLLVRDAASPDRADPKFPFLRNFSPYAGHAWANGTASFPQGNDQESTSESMQFNASLIHWGSVTGDTAIRDLGIYLYTTEQTAIEEYWLDMYERNFRDNQNYSLVSRVWGNSYDNGTFWTSDITASYGIELYPMHAGSFYLGHNKAYAQKLWLEIEANTEILSTSSTNPNLWHDTFWKFLSLTDPDKAIQLYNSYPDRILKFGVSDAHTYHWLHSVRAMGTLDEQTTADYPLAVVFDQAGARTYVAHNYNQDPIVVTFSDGYQLTAQPRTTTTNRDASVSGVLSTDFNQAYPGGRVQLTLVPEGTGLTEVVWYDRGVALGTTTEAPWVWTAADLDLGIHSFYAVLKETDRLATSNSVEVQVGAQLPYGAAPHTIPGTIPSGQYDRFEAGSGQNISYFDLSADQQGDWRPQEAMDGFVDAQQGPSLGWLAAGEWIEYTVDVPEAGIYALDLSYASGNAAGGGPIRLEQAGRILASNITFGSTSTSNWSTWATKNIPNISLGAGRQIIRIHIEQGEVNLGKMVWTKTGDLTPKPAVAHAGPNQSILLPQSTAQLDGTQSSNPDAAQVTYAWRQDYGPSVLTWTSQEVLNPTVTGLEGGVYQLTLTATTGAFTSSDQVLLMVSETGMWSPVVQLTAPIDQSAYRQGEPITMQASAQDLDGSITRVSFFAGDQLLGSDTQSPYAYTWNNAPAGNHVLTAQALDDDGLEKTSKPVSVEVAPIQSCTTTAQTAQQGSFSQGYRIKYETVGTQVVVTFTLLDTNKSGPVAYLWQAQPFSEAQMDQVGDRVFTRVLSSQTPGATIRYAVKVAFAGGLAVTQYIDYQVGTDCDRVVDDADGDGVKDAVDQCPNTPAAAMVDVHGCTVFSLPSENWEVQAVAVSCRDQSDGALVFGVQDLSYAYQVRVNGAVVGALNNANQGSLRLENQPPGNYQVCFSVDGIDGYTQCFGIQVVEPAALAAKAEISAQKGQVVLQLYGSDRYRITHNGRSWISEEQTATINLEKGQNQWTVTTDQNCQGRYEASFFLSENTLIYPNPVQDQLWIYVPGSDTSVAVYHTDLTGRTNHLGVLHIGSNRVIQLATSDWPVGLNLLRLSGTTTQTIHRIVKTP